MELFRNSHVYTTRLNLALKVVVKHLNQLACLMFHIKLFTCFLTFLFNSYCSFVHIEIKHYHNWIWQPYCHSCQKKQGLNGYENWIIVSVFRGLSLSQNSSILVTVLGSVYCLGACPWALSIFPYIYKWFHFLGLQLWQISLQLKCNNIKLKFLSTSSTDNYKQTMSFKSLQSEKIMGDWKNYATFSSLKKKSNLVQMSKTGH